MIDDSSGERARVNPAARAVGAARGALAPAWKTARFLAAVMLPVSLAVKILDVSGILRYLASAAGPLMKLLGLPGEASLVFLSAMTLNIYSAIAVIGTIGLDIRQTTIIAVMSLMAHNLFVETAIMKKTGSSAAKMVALRIGSAFVTAAILNLLLPQAMAGSGLHGAAAPAAVSAEDPAAGALAGVARFFLDWLSSALPTLVRIGVVVTLLMVLQRLMEEFGVVDILSRAMAPVMKLLGLPPSASFLWIVANVVGFAYGSAVLIERVSAGKISPMESDLFNHHAGISHSLLEDTLLFVAIGVPLFWALVPRLAMAILIVWLERLRRFLFRRSFKVGVI